MTNFCFILYKHLICGLICLIGFILLEQLNFDYLIFNITKEVGDCKKYLYYFVSPYVLIWFFAHDFCILALNVSRFINKVLMTIMHIG